MLQGEDSWNLGELQDPFLQDGEQIIYRKQHKFTISIQEKHENVQKLPNPEILAVKVVLNQQHGAPKTVKMQLTSDSDLYFNFAFSCNDWEFKRVREKQNFFIEFREYPGAILKNLEKLYQPQGKYSANFTIFSQAEGRMDIIRHSEFKDDTIMSFDFTKSNQEQIHQSIQYRYDQLRNQYIAYSQSYQEMTEIVKSKNPSLMMQINKALRKK